MSPNPSPSPTHSSPSMRLPSGHPFALARTTSSPSPSSPPSLSSTATGRLHLPISALYCSPRVAPSPSPASALALARRSGGINVEQDAHLAPHLRPRPRTPLTQSHSAMHTNKPKPKPTSPAYSCAFPNCSTFSLDSTYSTDSYASDGVRDGAVIDIGADVFDYDYKHTYNDNDKHKNPYARSASPFSDSDRTAYTLRTPVASPTASPFVQAADRGCGSGVPARPTRSPRSPRSPTAWLSDPLSPSPPPIHSPRAMNARPARSYTYSSAQHMNPMPRSHTASTPSYVAAPPAPFVPLPKELAIFDQRARTTLLADLEYIAGRKLRFPLLARLRGKGKDEGEGRRTEAGTPLRKEKKGLGSVEDEYMLEVKLVHEYARRGGQPGSRVRREGNWI